jgi:signal transduction histidine kinase
VPGEQGGGARRMHTCGAQICLKRATVLLWLHCLSRMDAQLDRLTKLISDLLDISRMQAGKLPLRLEQLYGQDGGCPELPIRSPREGAIVSRASAAGLVRSTTGSATTSTPLP